MSTMLSIYFSLFLLISIITKSYGQVTCASGWVQNGGKCYLIAPAFNSGSAIGTWDQCNAYCPTSYTGATMLCVNNAAEDAWIVSQYSQYTGIPPWGYYWIGYTDMPPYGGGKGTKQYGWVTGCSSTYTNWYPSQPSNSIGNDGISGGEDYAGVSPGFQWRDYHFSITYYCGCQYNPALVVTPSSSPSTNKSSGPTSSPTATPSLSSSNGDVSE